MTDRPLSPFEDPPPALLTDEELHQPADPPPAWPATELKVSVAQFTALILVLAGLLVAVELGQPVWVAGAAVVSSALCLAATRWSRRG